MAINQFLGSLSVTGMLLTNPVSLPTTVPRTSSAENSCMALGTNTGAATAPDLLAPSAAARPAPAWRSILSKNAQSILELRAGWDGPGSIPVSASTASLAMIHVSNALDRAIDVIAPRLVPGGDGSVQIEWHARHAELEFCIDRVGRMSIWIRDHMRGAEFDGEDEKALALFYRWAPWVASKLRDVPDVPAAPQMASFSIAA